MLSMAVIPVLAVKPDHAGPTDKATGEIWFDHPDPVYGEAYMWFNAHEVKGDRPAKGECYYSDDDGYYRFYVDDVTVWSATDIEFSGVVVDSTHTGVQIGDRVNIRVLDMGTPGSDGDLLSGMVNGAAGPPSIPVTAGNLVVHTYD
jgi:hypothetical protein